MNFNISHPFCTKLSTLFFKKTRVKLKLKTNTSCSNAEKMQKNERPNDKRKKKEYDFTEATSVCDNYNNVSYSFASLDSLFALLQIPHICMSFLRVFHQFYLLFFVIFLMLWMVVNFSFRLHQWRMVVYVMTAHVYATYTTKTRTPRVLWMNTNGPIFTSLSASVLLFLFYKCCCCCAIPSFMFRMRWQALTEHG